MTNKKVRFKTEEVLVCPNCSEKIDYDKIFFLILIMLDLFIVVWGVSTLITDKNEHDALVDYAKMISERRFGEGSFGVYNHSEIAKLPLEEIKSEVGK